MLKGRLPTTKLSATIVEPRTQRITATTRSRGWTIALYEDEDDDDVAEATNLKSPLALLMLSIFCTVFICRAIKLAQN